MMKILFVCHGNICRSTMAECVFIWLAQQRGMADRFEVDSAAATREELGNPIYPPAARKLREKGVPILPHRARLMTRADYERFDLLIGMDEENMRDMRRLSGGDPAGKLRRLMDYTDRPGEVSDPWYTRDFESAYQDILLGCEGLLDALTK